MIAAIYARKSTEQVGVAEEEKSVTRQVEHARAYAATKGWTVAEEYVYSDDGISGAEFERRPGLQALLAALKPTAPFQVLIVMDKDRLGRETFETGYILKRLSEAGVRVFEYLKDREVLLDTPTNKLIQSIEFYAAEAERDQASRRVRDAMERKAKAGHVTGGKVYGYGNAPVTTSDGKRLHVKRVINEAEAQVVRRIFERAAGGAGYAKVAHELNATRIPPPRRRDGRLPGWCSSTVCDILHRELYRGVVIWGKTKKRDAWGHFQSRRDRRRPADDWIRTSAPELRIVSEQLWRESHERLRQGSEVYGRVVAGRPRGRPVNGIESRYLLTGHSACGECGGSLTVRPRRHGAYYECLTRVQRGRAVCGNSMTMPMEAADRAVLDAIEGTLLRPDMVAAAIEEAAARLRPDPEQQAGQRQRLQAELGRVETGLGRLADAIAGGIEFRSLKEAVREREQERERLQQELAALDQLAQVGQLDHARLRRALTAKLDDWRGLLRRHVKEARRILAALLDGRLRFMPREDERGGNYVFEGAGRLEPVLEGVVFQLAKGYGSSGESGHSS